MFTWLLQNEIFYSILAHERRAMLKAYKDSPVII
jgi:hypothetical protein